MSERCRKVSFHLNLFPEELQLLNEKAEAAGMSRSGFLRNAIQDSTVISMKNEETSRLRKTTDLLCEVCDRLDKVETELIGMKNSGSSQSEATAKREALQHFSEIEEKFYELADEYAELLRGDADAYYKKP